VILKTSQESSNAKEILPIKSKDFKVKFRHYNSKEKKIKILFDIIGSIIIFPLIFLIILSITQGQFINIVGYGIIITSTIIINDIVEHKLKKNARKRLYASVITRKEQLESQIRYPIQDKSIILKKEDNFLVFVSYATKDADIFKIREISEALTNQEKITDVLYWQEDMQDNIIKYMNDNLEKCDVMLLFCSPNALTSEPVEKEWTAADIMGKPIIPIFNDPDHIPALLKTRLGVKFDPFNFQKNTDKIYSLILKKMK
jgi:hypothetical protein